MNIFINSDTSQLLCLRLIEFFFEYKSYQLICKKYICIIYYVFIMSLLRYIQSCINVYQHEQSSNRCPWSTLVNKSYHMDHQSSTRGTPHLCSPSATGRDYKSAHKPPKKRLIYKHGTPLTSYISKQHVSLSTKRDQRNYMYIKTTKTGFSVFLTALWIHHFGWS